MIRINIPGFYDSDTGGPRWGDAQIIDDGKRYLVIDGYCDIGATRLIKRLKARKIKSPYLAISHAHWDHYCGIRKIINDSYFTPKALYCQNPDSIGDVCTSVRSEKATLRKIIAEAKSRGIAVKYLKNGSHVKLGDIDFYVYQKTSAYTGNSDAYLNDGSLCFWFKSIGYWTSGDGPMEIYTMCKAVGAKPKLIKIPHHGNNCPRKQATGMKSLGTLYCWDNDYSTKITDFLQTGREDCIGVKMTYISCHGDINLVACNKRVAIYKGANVYKYACTYTGKTTLKSATLKVVTDTLKGKYGTADARITGLIDAGFYPASVQTAINTLYKLIKG